MIDNHAGESEPASTPPPAPLPEPAIPVVPAASSQPRPTATRLLFGAGLMALGAIWLANTLGILERLTGALAVFTICGGLAAACVSACQANPRRRWGLLIVAGLFAGTALIPLVPKFLEPVVLLSAVAAGFLAVSSLEPHRRWALIASWVCLVLGATAGLANILDGALGGPIFFLGLAVVFVWHFLTTDRDWAVIPAGLCVTFALVTFTEWLRVPDRVSVMAFWFGLSASFAVYFLVGKPDKVRWAATPTIAFASLGLLTLLFSKALVTFGVPLLLMGFGLYVIVRSQRELPPVAAPHDPVDRDPVARDPVVRDPVDP